jgi:Uma2 family endonuclease
MTSVATYAALEEASAETEPRFEAGFDLVDGVLVERNMGMLGSVIATRFSSRLTSYVDTGVDAWVGATDGGFQFPELSGGRLRFPDVSVVLRHGDPRRDIPAEGWADFPADLIVEVVSPNDEAENVDRKVLEWLAAGVRLVWVVYPVNRHVTVFRPDGSGTIVKESETLTGEDVLSGFTCSVSELFPTVPVRVESD